MRFLAEGEALTILGTSLTLQDVTQHEIRNRIRAGWRLFWKMKPLLQNRRSPVKARLRLFESTVGSCVLWCAASWTPRAEELRLLTSAWRSMLRRIVGYGRAPEEDYLTWIERVTRKAESMATSAGIRTWVVTHSRLKWLWAGHVARRPTNTWVRRVTAWRDAEWQAIARDGGVARPLRPSRRRWVKWEDSLRRFCAASGQGMWTILATDRAQWVSYVDTYAEWCAK